eukprot:1007776-Amphidinium_carterae.2
MQEEANDVEELREQEDEQEQVQDEQQPEAATERRASSSGKCLPPLQILGIEANVWHTCHA